MARSDATDAMSSVDVMVLCAGLGTRLRPLTLELPKPAVPVLNVPLVAYALKLIRGAGGLRVVINTHWLPEIMAAVAKTEADRLGTELLVSHEPRILGSGGALWQARKLGSVRRDRHLLVLNGDVLTDVDLGAVLSTHRAAGAAATMVLRQMPAGAGYTPLGVDSKGKIVRIGEHGAKSAGGFFFTGVHVLSPEALDLLPDGESSVITSVYAPLLARGATIQAHVDGGLWLDLGDPAGYLDANLQLLRNELPAETREKLGLPPPGLNLIDPSALLATSATLSHVVAGSRAIMGDGATIERSVIWPGSVVPAGVRVAHSVVTPRVTVGAVG
jgi:mannose-1-phosphate guanylyltransferase